MPTRIYNITKEFLTKEYTDNKKSARDLAKHFGCSHHLILTRLKDFNIPRRKQNKKREDITGKIFGKWTVQKLFSNHHHNSKSKWVCKCECGIISNVSYGSLVNNQSMGCIRCRSSGPRQKTRNSNNRTWTGYKEIPGTMWCYMVTGARQRNLEVKITIEDIWELFIKQNRKCALSGLSLKFATTRATTKQATASLDRIDSSIGYLKDNIQWIHKDINRMKMAFSQDYFIDTCKKIAKYKRIV